MAVAAATLTAAGFAAVSTGASARAASSSCKPTQFFVATKGSDAAKGSIDAPWKTIEHARDYIRDHALNSANKMHCDIDVNVRAGDYQVSSTIDLTDQDSGSNGHQVVYRSYDGSGQARLLGARKIKGWQPYHGSVYRTKVPAGMDFHTLFENNTRAVTARYPNIGSGQTLGPYLQTAESTDDALTNSTTWMAFNSGEWDQSWDLHDAQAVVWSGGHWSWFTDTDPILNVNWTKGFATLKYPTRYSLFSQVGSRYFLQNSLSFLDQAGEYYLDSQTHYLYYWPRSGSIANTTVWAPTVKTILSISGSSQQAQAENITVSGFALEYSDFADWYRYGWNASGDSGEVHKYPEYDRQIEMPRNRYGMVTLTNTNHVDLTGLHITNTGFHAVYMLFANTHDTVSNSLIEHSGADAVKIEGGYPGEGDISHNNTLTDNYIDSVGELVPGDASGYDLVDSNHNTLSNSVIQHSARYAVSLKGITTVANDDNYASSNTLKYLAVAHAGEDSGDMGALDFYGIQNFDPHPITTKVSQVTVTDVNADPSMPDVVPSGIHMDSGGCGVGFDDVVVTNTEYRTPYHGATDCNSLGNVSWNTGFDDSQMQYNKIGVKKTFPYLNEIPSRNGAVSGSDGN